MLFTLIPIASLAFADSPIPFRIHVFDEATKRGVPLVELEAVSGQKWWTDSNGLVAISDPVLMGQTAFFYVRSHGYEIKKDGFGFPGRRLEVKPAGRAEIGIKRNNIAERLYRVTGGGIYRHTVAMGEKPPIKQPLLNAQVIGSDSVQMVPYKGKLYWFWGDTNRVGYPLGNFNTTGATSLPPDKGGLDPDVGVDLEYFTGKDGFARGVAPIPGEGPTWITGVVVFDDDGKSDSGEMYAFYMKIKNSLDVYERGLVEWVGDESKFDQRFKFRNLTTAVPGGHVMHVSEKVENNWLRRHVYFTNAAPFVRILNVAKGIDPEGSFFDVFGCTVPSSDAKNPEIKRDVYGRPAYSWERGRPALDAQGYAKLINDGKLKPDEVPLPLHDPDTGKRFIPHAGSTVWNKYRQKWIMVTTEIYGGPSFLGELWYAEADSPVGPWVYARKILTHEKYSFYNPKLHPVFFKEDGRIVYFEGTYTTMFSGNTNPTPDYEYNQIMHRMQVDDPRLNLPTPIYEVENGTLPRFVTRNGLRPDSKGRAPFSALDRLGPGVQAVFSSSTEGSDRGRLAIGKPAADRSDGPLFFAMPPDAKNLPASAVALHERFDETTQRYVYAVRKGAPVEKDDKLGVRVMYVWENPKADEPTVRAEEVLRYRDASEER